MHIQVVPLGPDGADDMTLGALRALRQAKRVLLRTGRHGAAELLRGEGITFETLDTIYEENDDFDALNRAAADAALSLAAEGPLCYAVPDPATDETVRALKAAGARLDVLPGVTQAAVLQAQMLETELPHTGGYTVVTATDLPTLPLSPGLPLLVTEVNSRLLAGEVKLALLDVYAPDMSILFDGAIIPLDALDRQAAYSHLSRAAIPPSGYTDRSRYTFQDLLAIMARLRDPETGCPWDREQTHQSLRQYVIEEAYEVVDAIDGGDPFLIADELGDVLLQVTLHAQVAKEHGEFTISDVLTAICHKMITRHAHIFGDIHCETAEDVLKSWESIKQKEKGHVRTADAMRDVPAHLPALLRAAKVQKKAEQVGFDWDSPLDALEKVDEETAEVREELTAGKDPEAEFGDLLFATVNAARLAGVKPELALAGATEKFIRRFTQMEEAILRDGKAPKGMTLSEMDVYWASVKARE